MLSKKDQSEILTIIPLFTRFISVTVSFASFAGSNNEKGGQARRGY